MRIAEVLVRPDRGALFHVNATGWPRVLTSRAAAPASCRTSAWCCYGSWRTGLSAALSAALALDAAVSPARILSRQLLHQRTDPGGDRWPPRRVRVGPFPADKTPVPGQQGAGVTSRCNRRRPGSSLARAASTARSAQAALGRATWRRNIPASCRGTRISASFATSLRAKSASQPNTRTMKR